MGSTFEDAIFAPISGQVKDGLEEIFKNHKASFRDFAAHTVIHAAIKQAIASPAFPQGPGPVLSSDTSPPAPGPASSSGTAAAAELGTIGIIGSGAAGLYTAMILQSLGIQYEILEANANRIGGRLFTHRFNGEAGYNAPVGTPARYDYFDVGAMRFPRIPFMDRVFDLFRRIGIEDLFVPYKLSADNNLKYYNTQPPTTQPQAAAVEDYFRVSVSKGGTVPDNYAQAPPSFWTERIFRHYKERFAALDNPDLTPIEINVIFEEAWAELTSQDHHTTRSFMRAGLNGIEPYPTTVIEWLEMFESGTGLYDDAFVESVMSSLDFDWPWPLEGNPADIIPVEGVKTTEWVCIDGGSDHIARKMAEGLQNQPKLGSRVVKIAAGANSDMEVTLAGNATPKKYSQVISTVPLGCLGAMDTDGCDLLYIQKQAVRALKIGASSKIGVRFEKRWWQDPAIMAGATVHGGQSATDVPVRTCVYPSYGLDVRDAPGVLLASYTWSQDALRIGSAIQPGADDGLLLDLVLENLEKLHGMPRANFGPVTDYYAHSFYSDVYTRGAFGGFGPGQFGHPGEEHSLFASLKAPSPNGKFHIAGEPTSVHHGWVLGSLNSAWRAVYNALDGYPALRTQLIREWGIPDEENTVHLDLLEKLSKAKLL